MIPLTAHPGADRMMEIDPHGFTLTLVAVAVVFSALIILYLIYSLSGNIFSGKYKKKKKPGKSSSPDPQTAAAIAMALDRYASEGSDGTPAAIALALHLYLSGSVHDYEPGIITIRRDIPSSWSDKTFLLKKKTQTR